MEDGGLGNNHLNFHGGSSNRLSAESLLLIDMRLLSQSELRTLAHCSSLSPSSSGSLAASAGGDDDLTPKIDRSVFNESAGSRKQTFLRLRLARHPQPPGPPSPQRQRNDSSREENLQIASLLRSLFNVDTIQSKEEDGEGDVQLVENEGQPPFSFPIHNNGNVYKNPYFDSVQNVLIQGTSGSEIKRKRGRPRKIRNPSDVEINGETDFSAYATYSVDKTFSNLGTGSRYGGSGISIESNASKRKRGRPPKNRNGFNKPAMNCKSVDKEELVNLENREGRMVDLSALEREELVNLENREGRMVDPSAFANASEDPYGEELRRITDGLKSKEEILSFLEQLDGKWVNAGKQKKLVKACDFGAYLPRGWKLMLCIKRKFSNFWLACRRYISPDGQQFETCKEVSTYLQSLLESRSRNQLSSLQSENKTLGQPVLANKSVINNSDSMDLLILGSETKHSLESRRTNSEVCEEPKGAESGDAADRVNTSRLEKGIPAGEFLNGDNNGAMKKRDYNMENLAVVSNPEDEAKMMTTEELSQYFSSQLH